MQSNNTKMNDELHAAVVDSDLVEVKKLATSENINSIIDDRKFAPLHYAALCHNDPTIAAHLLSIPGCDINKVCAKKNPPIIWAALKGHGNLVNFFLRKGAKVDPALISKYSKFLKTNYPQILETLKHPETVLQQSSHTWQQPAASSSSIRQRNPQTYSNGTEMSILNK
jgi:ankyrin repeat protein